MQRGDWKVFLLFSSWEFDSPRFSCCACVCTSYVIMFSVLCLSYGHANLLGWSTIDFCFVVWWRTPCEKQSWVRLVYGIYGYFLMIVMVLKSLIVIKAHIKVGWYWFDGCSWICNSTLITSIENIAEMVKVHTNWIGGLTFSVEVVAQATVLYNPMTIQFDFDLP